MDMSSKIIEHTRVYLYLNANDNDRELGFFSKFKYLHNIKCLVSLYYKYS